MPLDRKRTELSVQRYIRKDPNLSTDVILRDLRSVYGITSSRHQKIPNLILLKYDQRTSRMSERIVQECRGLVLDEKDDWNVVAMAFYKFFNYGETNAPEIDWSTAVVQEKLDGTLCLLYPYAESWHIATTGTPDARGKLKKMTIAEYFWETFHASGMVTPSPNCSTCFFFELTGPGTRLVVDYGAQSRLTVLGCRNLVTLKEASATHAAALLQNPSPDAVAKSFSLRSFDEITATFGDMDPGKQEGYVVVDGSWNRVKVKHPGFLALRHAGSPEALRLAQPRSIVEMVRSSECSEVLASFPELSDKIADATVRYEALVAAVAADGERLAGIKDRDEFIKAVNKSRWAAALWDLRKGRAATAREAVNALKLAHLVELLGY